MFAKKAEFGKHVTETGIQCGFYHLCRVRGEELECPELRKCVEMDHMDFSWHPTSHISFRRLSVDWITLRVHGVEKNLALIFFIVTTSILVSK